MKDVTRRFDIMSGSDSAGSSKAIKNVARLFIDRSGTKAIAVAMHWNEHGLLFEDDSPTVLNSPFSVEDLGNAVVQALSRTKRTSYNARDHEPSDWPAYKASGERSVRNFEASFIGLLVEGANEANLVAVITGEPEKDAVLSVTGSISTAATPEDFGRRILQVYESCRDRRV